MQFDGGLVLAESGPREQRKAQVDGGGVQRVQARIQIHADRITHVHRPRHSDQDLREIGKDPPVARLVGIRQSRARYPAAESQVIQLAAHRPQTGLDIAKAFPVSKLSKLHRQKLVPAGEALALEVAFVTTYTLLKFIPRKVLHELGENSLAKVYPSLSATAIARQGLFGCHFCRKKLRSKNLKTMPNCHALRILAGIQNSCPGQ